MGTHRFSPPTSDRLALRFLLDYGAKYRRLAVGQAPYTFCPWARSQVPISPGGTEAQRGGVICSESHSKDEQEPGLNWDQAPGASGSHLSRGVAACGPAWGPEAGGSGDPPAAVTVLPPLGVPQSPAH